MQSPATFVSTGGSSKAYSGLFNSERRSQLVPQRDVPLFQAVTTVTASNAHCRSLVESSMGFVASVAVSLKILARRSKPSRGIFSLRRSRAARQDGVQRTHHVEAQFMSAVVQKALERIHRPQELPQLTKEQERQLQCGESLQQQERHGSMGNGFVAVDVEAPMSTVLSCLGAFEDYPSMIPVVRQVTVTSRGSKADGVATAKCNYRISKFQFGVSVEHTVDHVARTVRFDLDNDLPDASRLVLKEASGFWFVEPTPDGRPNSSRVWLYVSRLRANSLLPHWIVDYASERALRRATCWLKPVMEARWREQLCKQRPLAEVEQPNQGLPAISISPQLSFSKATPLRLSTA
jgi:hypothetical protein